MVGEIANNHFVGAARAWATVLPFKQPKVEPRIGRWAWSWNDNGVAQHTPFAFSPGWIAVVKRPGCNDVVGGLAP